MSTFQDVRLVVLVWQGALRPMPPPAIHPSASGLLPTPSMAVQIPTAKVTRRNTAQSFSIFQEKGWNLERNGGVFPSPVPVPELSPGRSASRLPRPQPDQPEVLSPQQVTRSHLHCRRDFPASLGSEETFWVTVWILFRFTVWGKPAVPPSFAWTDSLSPYFSSATV